jgi:hypothetical protein
MVQIRIEDHIAEDLAAAAASRGCTQEVLASALIEDGLRQDEDFPLTEAQHLRLIESIAQADRGEVVDGEIVMARFQHALERIASK